MEHFRYLKNVTSLALDADNCIGCGRCVEVCPHGVLILADNGLARIIDHDACIECGACAKNCPVAVVTVDAGVGCATGLFREWLGDRIPSLRGGGCC